MPDHLFFVSWESLIRVGLTAALTYAALILMLRLTGKRTLSKWNAFDFITTIALGSTFASVILSKDISIFDGLLALALLMIFQWIITKISVLLPSFRQLMQAKPAVLFDRGTLVTKSLVRERVAEAEVVAAVRAAGFGSLELVEAVILESDGSFSVISREQAGNRDALATLISDA